MRVSRKDNKNKADRLLIRLHRENQSRNKQKLYSKVEFLHSLNIFI